VRFAVAAQGAQAKTAFQDLQEKHYVEFNRYVVFSLARPRVRMFNLVHLVKLYIYQIVVLLILGSF
jgi:hypothetical protein